MTSPPLDGREFKIFRPIILIENVKKFPPFSGKNSTKEKLKFYKKIHFLRKFMQKLKCSMRVLYCENFQYMSYFEFRTVS